MKHLSLRILFLCILVPPLLYIFSIQSLEKYLHAKYLREIENAYIGDTRPLFDGSIRLKEALAENIGRYLETKSLLSWGVTARITVATRRGEILYPPVFEEEPDFQRTDPIRVAAENYALLNQGLHIDFDLKPEHNTLLANTLLILYIAAALAVLSLHYRSGLKKSRAEDQAMEEELARLLAQEKRRLSRLAELAQEKARLESEFSLVESQFAQARKTASSNEEEMMAEIVRLEDKISENLSRQAEQQGEIAALAEKLSRYEGKPKTRESETLQRRFKSIYKNISVGERAFDGFIGLTESMKIKAEEVIHQLNQNPALVPVKRKVFGKKGRETVLEVIFAYRGRLYFRRLQDNRIEIVAIGTKNAQSKDLEFLDSL